jgi:hypothetical protein
MKETSGGETRRFFNMSKHRIPEEIKTFRRLLGLPIEAVYAAVNDRADAASSTIDALIFQLLGGTDALSDPNTLHRLSQLSEPQLLDAMTRLQQFKSDIAPAWTATEVEALAILWGKR